MRNAFIALLAVTSIACTNTSALYADAVVSGNFADDVVSVDFVPPGLSPGDTYQIAFVTSGERDAMSPDIADYHAFVRSQAILPGAITENWGIGWSAIAASLNDLDALSNAGISAPVYSLDGTLIATGSLDFWDGSHSSPIWVDQNGSQNATLVWTGIQFDGTATFPLGQENVFTGNSSRNDANWAFFSLRGWEEQHSVYAVSEVLTVVPEPTTLGTIFMLTGLAAIGGIARRKRDRPTVASQA